MSMYLDAFSCILRLASIGYGAIGIGLTETGGDQGHIPNIVLGID